jgi:hypothetical protein
MGNKRLLILSTFLTFLVALPFLLNSCGSGGQGVAGQGTAAVLVKDAFQVTLPDGQVIAEVRLQISQILMKKEMDPEDAWVEVPLNPSLVQPFNLLDLNNVAMLAAIGSVTAGEYEKVRLVLDPSFAPCIVLQGSTDCLTLKVPSNKIDIILKPHVLVPEGGTTSIVLDFVPDQSIHINNTGSSEKYILRPVIRAVTAEFPDGIKAHNEISGTVTGCTENTLELGLRRDTVHATIHYDHATQFFSDEDVDLHTEEHAPLVNGVTCNDLLGKRVEVKVLAMPDGTLYAVRVEIKGEFSEEEFPDVEEFHVSGTLATDSGLNLHTASTDYNMAFPAGTVRVEGRLIGDQTILARQIETQSVAEDFEVIGSLDSDATLTLTNAVGTVYTINFPTQPIKVEGTLDTTTNTIVVREIEALP